MVQRRSQVLCSAAVPLIEADHIQAGAPSLVGDPKHVGGVATAFEAMDEDERPCASTGRLPVAIAEELRVRRDRKEPGVAWDVDRRRMAPPPDPGKNRHQVRVKAERVRVEVGPGHSVLEGSLSWDTRVKGSRFHGREDALSSKYPDTERRRFGRRAKKRERLG